MSISPPATCDVCNRVFQAGDPPVEGNPYPENNYWQLKYHMNAEHSDMLFMCPRSRESMMHRDWKAFWQKGHMGGRSQVGRSCSYCGSMSAEDFFTAVEAGAEVGPTDKSYKVYVTGAGYDHGKFYFQHFITGTEEENKVHVDRFIQLHNDKKMKIGYPGHFYTLPFFCAKV